LKASDSAGRKQKCKPLSKEDVRIRVSTRTRREFNCNWGRSQAHWNHIWQSCRVGCGLNCGRGTVNTSWVQVRGQSKEVGRVRVPSEDDRWHSRGVRRVHHKRTIWICNNQGITHCPSWECPRYGDGGARKVWWYWRGSSYDRNKVNNGTSMLAGASGRKEGMERRLPRHKTPEPRNPELQVHTKDPIVLTQAALELQSSVPKRHSLMSGVSNFVSSYEMKSRKEDKSKETPNLCKQRLCHYIQCCKCK